MVTVVAVVAAVKVAAAVVKAAPKASVTDWAVFPVMLQRASVRERGKNRGKGFGKIGAKGLGKSIANGFSKSMDKFYASLDNPGKKVKSWGESLQVNGSAVGKLNGTIHATAPALENASVNSPVAAFAQTYAGALDDQASGNLTPEQELEAKGMMAEVLAEHSNKEIT
jgi:hypothetical protein